MDNISFSYPTPVNNCKVKVCSSDLFFQKGLKIVHGSRQFDTAEDVVQPSSLMGQLLKKAKQEFSNIDDQIDAFCLRFERTGEMNIRMPYRKVTFPMGVLCPLLIGSEPYCVGSFCNTNNLFEMEQMSVEAYQQYWDNLWKSLERLNVEKEIVNTAVPGGRFVNVSGSYFTIEQKLAVIFLSFFRYIQDGGTCQELRICMQEKDIVGLDSDGWQRNILPFLWQMSHLPFRLVADVRNNIVVSGSSPGTELLGTRESIDLLVNDVKRLIGNIEKYNNRPLVQNRGNCKESIIVNVDTKEMSAYIEDIRNNPDLRVYFGKARGNSYDRNRLLLLLRFWSKETTFFGDLNVKSIVQLSMCNGNLDMNETSVDPHWTHLGDKCENIVKYIGQKDKELQTEPLHQWLLDILPSAYRR